MQGQETEERQRREKDSPEGLIYKLINYNILSKRKMQERKKIQGGFTFLLLFVCEGN
jgi:hypothetical protein